MEERGGDPHQRVEERGGDPHQRVDERGGHPHERGGDPQVLEMLFCSSEMEMTSKISIIMKTGFRPL